MMVEKELNAKVAEYMNKVEKPVAEFMKKHINEYFDRTKNIVSEREIYLANKLVKLQEEERKIIMLRKRVESDLSAVRYERALEESKKEKCPYIYVIGEIK